MITERDEWFNEVGLAVFAYARENTSSDAAELGVGLYLVSQALKETDPDTFTAEQVSNLSEVILELESICKYSGLSRGSNQSQRTRKNIYKFLNDSKNDRVKSLTLKTQRLLDMLQAHGSAIQSFRDAPRQATGEYPPHVKEKFLRGLQKQSTCRQCCGSISDYTHLQWHPTRLLLKQGLREDQNEASFDILVSSNPINFWQDIGLRIPLKAKRLKFDDEHLENIPAGSKADEAGFCQLLRGKTFARVCFDFEGGRFRRVPDGFALEQRPFPGAGISLPTVLQHYKLSAKESISLAYILASAFWQFYDTRLLWDRWTSESVLFMPEEIGQKQQIPNKAYISVQFETGGERMAEYSDADLIIHRFPRILYFAIILLEIGLGKPLKLVNFEDAVTQLNSDFEIASQALTFLRQQPWDNFSNKDVYVTAVENCLRSADYKIQPPPEITTNLNTVRSTKSAPQSSNDIEKRRRIFYDKVVWPLEWLTKTGFGETFNQVTFFSQKRKVEAAHTLTNTTGIQSIPVPTLHGASKIDSCAWLGHLKEINQHIRRSLSKGTTERKSIQVAILDTGVDISSTFFQNQLRFNRIKGWKDFAMGSEKPVDTLGHGTFMATLVIETAPVADLYIGRVAENTKGLQASGSQIAEGIRWAGLEQKVDVISMSFGFPEPNKEIEKAIDEVRMKREGNIIFLASAGNFGPYQDNTFPSSHPGVVGFWATTSLGKFLDSNPVNIEQGKPVYGTYGDDIPQRLLAHRPEVCQPGTSAATAIAAGMTAFILAYITVLPDLVTVQDTAGLLKRAWTSAGMEKLFYKMSDDMGHKKRFLNPIKFFLDKPSEFNRFCAIYDCLQGKDL